MNIDVNLDKKFTSVFNELRNKYGEPLAKLNGFSKEQLSYTDFIDNFVDKSVVADASIDGNANVGHKDIVSLENEMSKPHSKLLGFNKIFYEINKKYGYEDAVEWLENEWDGHQYLHDAYNATYKPYCLSGDTKILTKDGIKPLSELVDKPIKVLGKNHGWEDATVKHFGKQELRKLIVERYGVRKEIKTTGNHRWFVSTRNGREVLTTDELIPGMKLVYNTSNTWCKVNPSPFGVAHGFFMGDGDKTRGRANFCGDKIALLPYFTPANVTGSDREYQTLGIPNNFKSLPSLNESQNYLYGWLVGYFAADGCVDTKGRCTLSSCRKDYLEFARDVLCVLGMPVNEIRYQDRVSNLTGEMERVYTLSLSQEYLKDDFFIRPMHKERVKRGERKVRNWMVVSVENTGVVDDVYCAVVPGSNSFTLDGNLLTHNCFAYDIEELVNRGMYFVEGFNAQPPKHLITYTDFVSEFISWCCNRTSGAVGLPSFLVYSFYFWKKDIEQDFYQHTYNYYRDQEFQRIIYKLNQPFLRGGVQSAFTNFTIFDRPYLEALFGGKEFPDGTFVIDYIDEIIDYQKAFMRVLSKIRNDNMMTFPVMTFALLRKDGKFVDEEFAKWCCDHNRRWADSNFFISDDINSLSNCCRLKSNIKDLGYFNSLGGTALEVGSVKVNTINLARLAYENPKEKYFTALKHQVLICLKTLDCIRHIIQRNVEKGLLPNYSLGILNMASQYNTIGIIGIYETLDKYGFVVKDQFGYTKYTDEGIEFAKDILKLIHMVKDEFGMDKDYKINIEQVPAERAASILMEKDKIFYPDEKYELPLYGNQWIPLGVKTSLTEKIKLSAILDEACSGGSIAHINLDAPFKDFDTAWEVLNRVADAGVTYFAFNLKISACENNHGFFGETCPVCGKPKVTTYQRIVGFLTPERTYSKERKAEFAMRDWFSLQTMEDM